MFIQAYNRLFYRLAKIYRTSIFLRNNEVIIINMTYNYDI
jgi:hypothetical protein